MAKEFVEGPAMGYAAAQRLGARSRQEDVYVFNLRRGPLGEELLTLVCDGAGGYRQGQLASQLAAVAFSEGFWRATGDTMARLRVALDRANRRLRCAWVDLGKEVPLVTTIVAVHLCGGVAHWISIGDSPLYLSRKGRLRRLNADHSLTRKHRDERSHTLRYALSHRPVERYDRSPKKGVVVQPGAKLICATDGLFTLGLERIQEVIAAGSAEPTDTVQQLLGEVEDAGTYKQDNTTVAVIARH